MFEPIFRNELTEKEKKRATESLIFLLHKRSGKIKARTVENGNTQRAYIDRDKVEIPTESSDSIIITGVLEAKNAGM